MEMEREAVKSMSPQVNMPCKLKHVLIYFTKEHTKTHTRSALIIVLPVAMDITNTTIFIIFNHTY